jgi:hypothetical protein
VHAHAGLAYERKDRRERNGLRDRRNRDQSEACCDLPVVCDPAAREMRFLRPQPNAMAEGGRILHRPEQHLGVGERRLGLRERDAAGFGELAHLGQVRPRAPR